MGKLEECKRIDTCNFCQLPGPGPMPDLGKSSFLLDVLMQAVDFKRPVYEQAFQLFKSHIEAPASTLS